MLEKVKLCDYGCGQEAVHQFKNGKWCCSKNSNCCLSLRNKFSLSNKGKTGPNKGKKLGININLSKAIKQTFIDGRVSWNKDKNHKQETIEKIRKGAKERYKDKKPSWTGKPRPLYVRDKISKSEKGKIISKESVEKRKNTLVKLGLMVPDEVVGDFKLYYRKVSFFTHKSLKLFPPDELGLIGPPGKDGAYNVDHMFSILEGFNNNVLPYIIGHKCNLRIIPWRENDSKKYRCSITLDKLCSEIEGF